MFHADRVDGVPYLINGNSGKNPSTAPQFGGFTGWTLFGVGRSITAEIRPHVDSVEVRAPARVVRGVPVPVSAVLTQGGREVPVAAPVSADWTASPSVHIGPRSGLRPWHVAWFDPVAGELTALRDAGSVVIAVTVNGVTARATVTLAAAGAAAA
jgi:hypothetical protein